MLKLRFEWYISKWCKVFFQIKADCFFGCGTIGQYQSCASGLKEARKGFLTKLMPPYISTMIGCQ